MPVVINITQLDGATPFLRQIGTALESPENRRIFGRATVPVIQKNFEELERASTSTLGHTGYWDKAARAVQQPEVESDGVSIGVSNPPGIGIHYTGGTVVAGRNPSRTTGRPTRYLTIPARSEAYGKRAGEFKNLRILFGRGRRPVALVESDDTAGSETRLQVSRNGVARRVKVVKPLERSGGIVMFWLVPKVTIRPNPRVVPPTEPLTEAGFDAVISYLERITERKAER